MANGILKAQNGVQGQIDVANWLETLATNNATNQKTEVKVSGVWVEMVKVKKWYSLRLMKWDATKKRKEYVRYIGTLAKCKESPVYAAEALRLEKRRLAVSGGEIGADTGTHE